MKSLNPNEEFARQVHRALHHLYEPADLRLSPLAIWLPANARADVPSGLRKMLLEGINSLKPDPKVPPDSNAWRVYQVLTYRFVELFSQEEVASQMAISPRQVRRLEHTAIQALTDHLTSQLESSKIPSVDKTTAPSFLESAVHPELSGDQQELDWLKNNYLKETTDVYRLVDSVIKTGESYLEKSSVKIQTALAPGLPLIEGQMTILRQVLLNLLLAAVRSCPYGHISIKADDLNGKVQIVVESGVEGGPVYPLLEISEYFDLAHRLVELSGGELELLEINSERNFGVCIRFLPARQVSVLVVDDNEDSLRLIERYLAGTYFLFQGVCDPQKVLSPADGNVPDIIVMDIMLPEVDGWELLGRIRAHPRYRDVPVIITTILPHEQLAGSLGADGFLRKPFSQETLFETLKRMISHQEPGLR